MAGNGKWGYEVQKYKQKHTFILLLWIQSRVANSDSFQTTPFYISSLE